MNITCGLSVNKGPKKSTREPSNTGWIQSGTALSPCELQGKSLRVCEAQKRFQPGLSLQNPWA